MFHTVLHGTLCEFKFSIPGKNHKLGIRVNFFYALDKIQSTQTGHFDICQNDIRIVIQNPVIGFDSVFRSSDKENAERIPVNQ